ncbi:hypothetical protein V8C26DRAFT_219073 [Trichoderma gracile]
MCRDIVVNETPSSCDSVSAVYDHGRRLPSTQCSLRSSSLPSIHCVPNHMADRVSPWSAVLQIAIVCCPTVQQVQVHGSICRLSQAATSTSAKFQLHPISRLGLPSTGYSHVFLPSFPKSSFITVDEVTPTSSHQYIQQLSLDVNHPALTPLVTTSYPVLALNDKVGRLGAQQRQIRCDTTTQNPTSTPYLAPLQVGAGWALYRVRIRRLGSRLQRLNLHPTSILVVPHHLYSPAPNFPVLPPEEKPSIRSSHPAALWLSLASISPLIRLFCRHRRRLPSCVGF